SPRTRAFSSRSFGNVSAPPGSVAMGWGSLVEESGRRAAEDGFFVGGIEVPSPDPREGVVDRHGDGRRVGPVEDAPLEARDRLAGKAHRVLDDGAEVGIQVRLRTEEGEGCLDGGGAEV